MMLAYLFFIFAVLARMPVLLPPCGVSSVPVGLLWFYLFVIFAVLARMPFMPHPWGFTPVAAALLYFGARGSRRQLWVPFALLAASDVILNKFVYAYPFGS